MRSPILFLFLFTYSVISAQTAEDIINKHFQATGGKEKWAKVYSVECSGNYVMGPGMLAPVKSLVSSKPSKVEYSEFSWQGMTTKTVMTADSGWSYNPFGGKRETDPLSPDDIRRLNLSADPQGLLFNYKEKGYTVDYLGTDDMDGTDVYKLRLTTKLGDMVYFFIDAETYYVLKIEQKVKLKDKEEKSYVTYSDFRKTDFGVILPFSHQQVDEQGSEQGGPVNFIKVEVNANMDVSMFNKPKKQ